MTVIGVDGRTYKDQASADKAAVRMAKAPKLDGSATTNNTTTTTPKTTTPTTSTNKSSNTQWSSTNYKDSDGYYSGTERNAATGGSEFGGSSKTSTQTSTQTPTSTNSNRPSDILIKGESEYDPNTGYYRASQTQQGGDTSGKQVGGQKTIYNSDQIRATWDKLPYEEQQKRLQASPGLKDGLAKMGITIKPKPGTTGETPTTPTTTGGDGWDYQDNSPERMKQIADNVNQFAQTDPYIFNNEDSFRKFFIDGKGRTPEQEAFLMDLYKNRKKYNELDNYTADNIGNMAVNGQIPDSYLTYLKNTNPDRYAAVMDAKARETDKIKDKASMDTISSMDGGADYTSQTSTVIEWLKSQGLFVDKDGNLIDDRTENYASEEEKGYLKQIADLNATNLDIDNTVKHTYEDLVKAYPGATKATLMAMAQDMNADLLREKENNLVELTRLQGYVGYMQSERQERDAVGQNAINQLRNGLMDYYKYSPQGLSEYAQAQYAATNITLDQANNGTETQKQMALDSVLTPIYEQYGSIIQRSKAQVINDIISYANNKGISLSQALEENFMTPLKNKDAYKQYQASLTSGLGDGNWTLEPIKDAKGNITGYVRVNKTTGEIVPYTGTAGAGTGTYQFSDEEIREKDSKGNYINTVGNDINSIGHILNSDDGLRVGTYTNSKGYTYNVYANREDGITAAENLLNRAYYGMTLQDAAQKRIGQGKDISEAKRVIQQKGLGLNDKLSDANVRKFIEAIGQWEGTLKGQSLDDWAKGGKDLSGYKQGVEEYYWRSPMDSKFEDAIASAGTQAAKDALAYANTVYSNLYEIANDGSLDQFIESGDFQKIMSNLNTTKALSGDTARGQSFFNEWLKAVEKSKIINPNSQRVINVLKNMIEQKLRDESGAAISSSEWLSNFQDYLPQAGESKDVSMAKMMQWEKNVILKTLQSAGMPKSDYEWIFAPDSKYYKTMNGGQAYDNATAGKNEKGTFEIGVGSVASIPSGGQYDDLFSILRQQ